MKKLASALLFSIFALGAFGACSSSPGGGTSKPPSMTCDADAGECTPPHTCHQEADCAPAAHCDLGTDTCVACTSNAHCTATQDCLRDQCIDRCTNDASCSNGLHCADGHCRECATDSQCPAEQHCTVGSCEKDACPKGTSDCAPNHAGVRTCASNGAEQTVTPCPASQTCVEAGAGAACQPWSCSPGLKSCAPAKDAVRTCADDGLSYSSTEQCVQDKHCSAGRCVTGECAPNQLLCKNGASYLCAPDGLNSTLQATCGAGQLCDEETGACRAQSCTPGQKQCFSTSVGTCRPDGAGYDLAPCALDETCVIGECKSLICAPAQTFCVDTTTFSKCDATGTTIASTTSCGANSRCISNGSASVSCLLNVCTPGTALCDGNSATVCKSDGTGPAAGGTNCTTAGGYCSLGACKAYACTPNQRYCVADTVYACQLDGSSGFVYQTCSNTGTHCNPTTAACESYKCTANATTCSNNLVVHCDATGFSSTTVKDCAASSQVCSSGACAPLLCVANTSYCKNGSVYACNSDGTYEYVSKLCAGNTYCSAANCVAMTCQPGQPTCNGNAVATCAADGSGPTGVGSPCGSGQTCVSGACQALTCTPNALFCASGDVQRCNALGTSAALAQHCFSNSYCDSGQCKPGLCLASKAYCTPSEALATCKSDGSGPVTPGTNCLGGQVCTPGGCTSSAVDTFGSETSSFTTGSFTGQIIRVTTARKLTQIELDVLVADNAVTWAVYSSVDGVNFTKVVTSVGGPIPAGFASSGPLAVELQAGSYYFIGAMPSYIISPYTEQSAPTQLSFGIALNEGYSLTGLSTTFTPTQNLNTHLHMRLTTTVP